MLGAMKERKIKDRVSHFWELKILNEEIDASKLQLGIKSVCAGLLNFISSYLNLSFCYSEGQVNFD